MEKTICNDNHKFGNFIERENSFTRICKCCQKETTYSKEDPDIIKEYQQQQITKELLKTILEKNINIIDSSDSLLTAISILIDNLSRIEITPTELITIINNLNEHYHKEDIERYQLIKNSIDFIELYFKHERLEIIGGKNALTIEQNDDFYDKWNNITEAFEPFLNEIHTQKNHLSTR